MSSANAPDSEDEPLELSLTRLFDAPVELVFRALTEPEHLRQWAAPKDCSGTHYEMDARPGGRWRSCMRWPDGTDHWQSGTVQAVEPDIRLVYSSSSAASCARVPRARGWPGPRG